MADLQLYKLVGDNNLQWGSVTSGDSEEFGYVQSMAVSRKWILAEHYYDNAGQPIGSVLNNGIEEIEVTLTCYSDAIDILGRLKNAESDESNQFNVDGLPFNITSIKILSVNQEFKKLQITGFRKDLEQ